MLLKRLLRTIGINKDKTMSCPLHNTEYQQYCCLHDKHQEDNTFEQCEYQQACSYLINNQKVVEWHTKQDRILND